MRNPHRRRPAITGFGIVDLMLSITIMVILSGVVMLSYSGLREKAERIGCTAHLNRLYHAFTGYVQDNGYWPQEPENLGEEGHDFYNWLIGEVAPYEADRVVWICPTEARANLSNVSQKEFYGSYVPTMFDRGRNTPWQWESQPWLLERVDNHKSGRLLILPNGTVQTEYDVRNGTF